MAGGIAAIDRHAGIFDGAVIGGGGHPTGLIVGDQHRQIAVKAEDDIGIVGRYIQGGKGGGALPHIRSDDDGTAGFKTADRLIGVVHDDIPLGRVFGDRLIQDLISDLVIGIMAEMGG